MTAINFSSFIKKSNRQQLTKPENGSARVAENVKAAMKTGKILAYCETSQKKNQLGLQDHFDWRSLNCNDANP